MLSYITIIICVLLLPVIYWAAIQIYKSSFEEEKNRNRKPLTSKEEIVVMLVSEAALVRIWYLLGQADITNMIFLLLYFMLIGMTILCMTDYWEKVVPNRILLFWLMIFILIVGFHGIYNMDTVLEELPYIVLGFLFCFLAFGLGYLIGRGSMGAGDVKLSFIMGLFLTSEYVVGAILYGCIISAIFSLVQMFRKKLTRKDALPFVPFLYIGLIIRYMIG